MNNGFRLSVAVPVHNEEQSLHELLRRIGTVLDGVAGGPHQILIVDDGSWDRTPELLDEAARQDPRLSVVSLSRNFGHQAALSAALDYVTGDALVLMDGDLQDAPEAIPTFMAKFEEGYDVVYATRSGRKEGWGLRFCYYLFYRLQATLSDTSFPLDAGDFGLMSRRVVDEAARQDPRLSVVSLSRNFGHQAALSAALDYVTGDALVMMDGDLQDAPEAIPTFMAKFEEGYDVVYATRSRRKEGWPLRFCYYLFYRLQAMLSDTSFPLDAGDFGLMSRRVVDQLRRMPERHRYLRGLRSWVGFKQIGLPVERAERYSGGSKYGLLGLLKLASDGIFAFSVVPLRLATFVGAAATGLSGVYAVYSLYAKVFLRRSPQGFTALVLLITFLSGVLLFFLGVIGEYLGRVYEELKGRPIYVVDRVTHYGSASGNPEREGQTDKAGTLAHS